MSEALEEVDVIIVGTSLVHSILASALVKQGVSVLHIDSNENYGDTTSTFSVGQLEKWVKEKESDDKSPYKDCKLELDTKNIEQFRNYKHRHFYIDLVPKLLFAESEMLSLLLKSKVYQYSEFLPLSNFFTYSSNDGVFNRLKNTKNEIFVDETLPLLMKRNLMKFLKIVMDWENQKDQWSLYNEKPLSSFLKEKFKMDQTHIDEIVYTLALSFEKDITTNRAIDRINKYLSSCEVYGPFPTLYSKYGGVGEIAQGFCRSAAVGGCTYKLNSSVRKYDEENKVLEFDDATKVKFKSKVVVSQTQSSVFQNDLSEHKHKIYRLICVVQGIQANKWFKDGESAAVAVFPPESFDGNSSSVQMVMFGSGSELCPKGTFLIYLTSADPKGQVILAKALDKIVLAVDHSTLLLKLEYTQLTNFPTTYVSAEKDENMLVQNVDSNVIITPMLSSELTYNDESIDLAKKLYADVLGQDDDFFISVEEEEEVEGTGEYM